MVPACEDLLRLPAIRGVLIFIFFYSAVGKSDFHLSKNIHFGINIFSSTQYITRRILL